MMTIQTVETRLENQYIVFITMVDETIVRRSGFRPFALSVVACGHRHEGSEGRGEGET
jgi:hypothetical protein